MPVSKVFNPSHFNLILILIVIGFALLALWRALRTFNPPNLLANSDFATTSLTGWQTVHQGEATAGVEPSSGALILKIVKDDAPGWAGVGRRVALEAGRRYSVTVDYHIAAADAPANVVLRILRRNPAGETVHNEEFSLPVNRRHFNHAFMVAEATTEVEIGIGLFGQSATTVEIEEITLKEKPPWTQVIWSNPLILLAGLILLVGIGIALYKTFRFLPGKAVNTLSARRRIIGMVVVNVALLFVFAELAALAIYFARDGVFFYTRQTRYEQLGEAETTQELTPKRIHPYFGYVDKPGWQRDEDSFWRSQDIALREMNNQGFGSMVDYPFEKSSDNQYIIGIFGGSAAEQFAILAGDKLAAALRQDDFFSDKEIVVLNFAKAGYKQPQQLLVLNYFLAVGQHFDMVINLDGFNEVAFAHRNYQREVDISMPHIDILDGLTNLADQNSLTPERLESLAKIGQYKRQLNSLAEPINASRLASVSFILEQYYALVLRRYEQAQFEFNELPPTSSDNSLVFIKPNETRLEDPVLFGNIADIWATSSVMMSRALKEEGIPYFHILQPNQHYSNKVFSEEEAAIALELEQPYYSTLVGLGYPALMQRFDTLAANEVNFFNGVPLFDGETRPVYQDNCCHYNELGNEILADFIATSILGWEEQKRSADFSLPNPQMAE
jgi:hypothetical protein